MADKNPFFATKPDDPKDVSWGLSTADACWRRGDRNDALRWLRRAVEAASEAEADDRALELAKIAADLATQIGSLAPPPPAPGPQRAATNPVQGMPAIPRAGALPQRPMTAAKLTGPSPVTRPPLGAKEPPRKADRKSITNEGPRSRGHVSVAKGADRPVEKAAEREKFPEKAVEKASDRTEPEGVEPPLPPPRKRSTSRADKAEAPRQPSRTDEIDEWPTEVVGGKDIPANLSSDRLAAALMPPAAGAAIALQAVRVLVWREPDGSVQVSAASGVRVAPSHALEATLVAGDASADLVRLLGR